MSKAKRNIGLEILAGISSSSGESTVASPTYLGGAYSGPS